MIATYSPEARGRNKRVFDTHQDRLVKELAFPKITEMDDANCYLAEVYLPVYNTEFIMPATEEGSAFILWIRENLEDILCEQEERTVSADNCVSFERMKLQIPANQYRCHYGRVRVRVHRYLDGSMTIFHVLRKLAYYVCEGKLREAA